MDTRPNSTPPEPSGAFDDGVYAELRSLATGLLRSQRPGHTLRTTALVHEAYAKLAGRDGFTDRQHYLAVAARAMRQILVDHARAARASKRGGQAERIRLDEVERVLESIDVDVLDLSEAMDRLGAADERKARVVELKFFGGLDILQTAHILGIGHATVERDWAFAKAWLRRELSGGAPHGP